MAIAQRRPISRTSRTSCCSKSRPDWAVISARPPSTCPPGVRSGTMIIERRPSDLTVSRYSSSLIAGSMTPVGSCSTNSGSPVRITFPKPNGSSSCAGQRRASSYASSVLDASVCAAATRLMRPSSPRRSMAHQSAMRGIAGLEVALEPLAVGVAQRRRDDQLRHLAADRLLRGVAECLLGRPVELEHPALMVHRDDAVERGREHRALARLARADRLLGPGALDLLAELEPDRRHQVEQVVVGLGLLLGEELDHTDESAHRADREGERAVHPALCGNGRAREVRVDRDVPDPGRRLALPPASGPALPGCEAGLAALLLERFRLARRVARVPALDAADALPIPAHLPQRAESPSHRPADPF